MAVRSPVAWNGSWNGQAENPLVSDVAVALSRGIVARSAPRAWEHASCKEKVGFARGVEPVARNTGPAWAPTDPGAPARRSPIQHRWPPAYGRARSWSSRKASPSRARDSQWLLRDGCLTTAWQRGPTHCELCDTGSPSDFRGRRGYSCALAIQCQARGTQIDQGASGSVRSHGSGTRGQRVFVEWGR
jgi:hypothetical protein